MKLNWTRISDWLWQNGMIALSHRDAMKLIRRAVTDEIRRNKPKVLAKGWALVGDGGIIEVYWNRQLAQMAVCKGCDERVQRVKIVED